MRLFRRKERKAEVTNRPLQLLMEDDNSSSINDKSLFTDAGRHNAEYHGDDMSLCTKRTTISQEFDRIRERNRQSSPANDGQSKSMAAFDSSLQSSAHDTGRLKPISPSTTCTATTYQSSPQSSAQSLAPSKSPTAGPPLSSSEELELREVYIHSKCIEDHIECARLGAIPFSYEPVSPPQENPSQTTTPIHSSSLHDNHRNADYENHNAHGGDKFINGNSSFPLDYSIHSDDDVPLTACDVHKDVFHDCDEQEEGSKSLMRARSPSTLRLTQDGLEKLDEMAYLDDDTTLSLEERSMGYNSWLELQQRRRLLLKRLEERDKRLQKAQDVHHEYSEAFMSRSLDDETDYRIEITVMKNGKTKKKVRRPPPKDMTALQKLGLVSCVEKKLLSSNKKKDSICEMSLAPMNTFDEEDVQWSSTKKCSPLALNPMKKKNKPVTKEELLAIERQKHMKAQEERAESELKEKNRISRMRAAYLEKQRALEAEPPPRGRPMTLPVYSSNHMNSTHGKVTPDISIIEDDSSTGGFAATSLLCVVCLLSPRTHIGIPCMHYSMCELCVARMNTKDGTKCPICIHEATLTRVLF